jgi:hypothetical protein
MKNEENWLLDMMTVTIETFQREKETPNLVIMAASPLKTAPVDSAISRICGALMGHVPEEDIVIVTQDTQVEMMSGEIITLGDDDLMLSLQYPTKQARVMTMCFGVPQDATIH